MKILSRLKIQAEDDEWFNSLTEQQKKDYIKEHPNSKYAKNSAKPNPKKEVKKSKNQKYEATILTERGRGDEGEWVTDSFEAPSNLDAILYLVKKYDLEWSNFNDLEDEIDDFRSGDSNPLIMLETEDPSDYYDSVTLLVNKTTNKEIFRDDYFLELQESRKSNPFAIMDEDDGELGEDEDVW